MLSRHHDRRPVIPRPVTVVQVVQPLARLYRPPNQLAHLYPPPNQLEDSGSSASSGTSPVERLVEFSNEEAMTMVLGQLEHQVTASRGAFDGMLSQTEAMADLVCCICTLPRHGVHRFGHRFRIVS
jgi:hypothetical protein